MLKNFISRIFDGRREVHAKLDEAILRSESARKRAREVCETIEIGSTARASVDWGPSMEAVARAEEENPLEDVRLPLEVDGQPAPPLDEAAERARERRVVFPDEA